MFWRMCNFFSMQLKSTESKITRLSNADLQISLVISYCSRSCTWINLWISFTALLHKKTKQMSFVAVTCIQSKIIPFLGLCRCQNNWNHKLENLNKKAQFTSQKLVSIYTVRGKKNQWPFSQRGFTMCNLSRHALVTNTNLHVMPPFSTLYK